MRIERISPASEASILSIKLWGLNPRFHGDDMFK